VTRTVIAFGELLWDLLPDRTTLGGAPFNFISRVHSLGDTGLMISRIGQDSLGRKAAEKIDELGLDRRFVQTDSDCPTGTVKVYFDAQKNPDYIIVPDVAYDRIEPNQAMTQAAAASDCFCFGTLSQRAERSRSTLRELIASAENSFKLLDINLRKNCFCPETVRYSIGAADALKLNEDEVPDTARIMNLRYDGIPEFCERMIEQHGLRYCLVTLGEKGVFAVSRDGQKTYVPGYRIVLADSLGAGDAFTAGFVHKMLRGESLKNACSFGNKLGAVVASKPGATAPVTLQEISQLDSSCCERNIKTDLKKYSELQ
jgi:fructokinase